MTEWNLVAIILALLAIGLNLWVRIATARRQGKIREELERG